MKRIIIDTDPGIDDAQAIMMAYMHPDVKIEAITSVTGNVGVEHTTANVPKIFDALGAEPIPVHAGARSALVETGELAGNIHGNDGLDKYLALMKNDNPRSLFMANVTGNLVNNLFSVKEGSMSYAADPLAMAVLMEPEIVLESVEKFVQIERYGKLSRGMTVVDWWGISNKHPNANIILKVDALRFYDLMKMAVV